MKIFFTIFFVTVVTAANQVSDSVVFKKQTETISGLLIDGFAPSMFGSKKSKDNLKFGSEKENSSSLWITKFEVVAKHNGKIQNQEFMCHSFFSTQNEKGLDKIYLSMSQGQESIVFPKGYSLRIPRIQGQTFSIEAMTMNNNYKNLKKIVDFDFKFEFVDEETAIKAKMIPLVKLTLPVVVEKHNHRESSPVYTSKNHVGHWIVPPGRHEYSYDVSKRLQTKKRTQIHYIYAHLHPYAESIQLYDADSKTILFEAKTTVNKDLARLEKVPIYSSENSAAIHVGPNGNYLVKVVYNNTTTKDIDAMAGFKVFLPEADVSPEVSKLYN